ncbi:zinc finger, CCHC-type containing protein [Tanacetum coccineum]
MDAICETSRLFGEDMKEILKSLEKYFILIITIVYLERQVWILKVIAVMVLIHYDWYGVNIIHETTTPYTPQQNGVAKRKNKALKEIVNSMAVVRLTDPKRKTLGGKGINCIFVGYVEHSKAYMFYVIEPNDSVSINSIIESKDAIFNENRFSSIPRPKDVIPNSVESRRDDHSDDVPSKTPEPRKGKRVRKAKSHGSNFQLYLVEGSRDQVGSQHSYCFSIEEDPRTYDEAMQSRDTAFWKEAIDDEIGSIMENNTWVLSDLPPGCKPLGFRQKEGIDYFDTYAPVAPFSNGDLDEEVYMKQPKGFVMPGNEHKVCKLVKSLYGLKQASKQWHQKFDEVVLSSGFHLNQFDKCVYSKFDSSGKGVIICLYVDDMLIFGTDQNQVDKTKKFLSSRFSMKDMGEADVILGIKIKRDNKGIVITQSHYIEKILKKFNREDCSPVSTPMDPVEKLKPNTGKPVDQLEYIRAIGCLMYAMTSTRPDIAYTIGRLNRFISIPSRQHWQAITRVFKYLKDTMNYGLSYVGYPSVLEAYSNARWINHVEDSSSTSGWMFLIGGGAISWASKKQTCITGSTMESEFVALAAAVKEAEWLRNLIHEIPIWPKPIAPISIRCDSAPKMAKAYSQVYNRKSRHLGNEEIKRLKRIRIPLVKVRWNSRRGPEFTWEREDSFKKKYPHLFTNRASSSTTIEITQEVVNATSGGIFLYKTPNQAYQLLEDKVLLKLDWDKNQKTKSSLKKIIAFANEGSSNPDRDKIMARIYPMTIKMDAQYKELQSRAKEPTPILSDDDMPMSPSNSKAYQPPQARNEHVNAVFTRSGKSYNPSDSPDDQQNNFENSINFDSDDEDDEPTPQPKAQPTKPVKETSLPKPYKPKIPKQNPPLIEGTLLEEEIFSKFDEFMAMSADENFESESNTEEPPFEKITINTNYKIKTSIEEPPTDLELKPLPDNLEYVILKETDLFPVIHHHLNYCSTKIILVSVLKKRKPLLGKQKTFLLSSIITVTQDTTSG